MILVGLVWGLGRGFAIVAVGVSLGEIANYLSVPPPSPSPLPPPPLTLKLTPTACSAIGALPAPNA
jgi:hypothetical protein